MLKSKRLEVLTGSLEKKEKMFNDRLQNHFDTVKLSNGQPLNDKRGGHKTLRKWEQQNNSLRTLNESIEITKRAIENEKSKIAHVENTIIPEDIKNLIDSGVLVQWRKHPTFFFVEGVDKARIHLLENGQIACRYVRDIPDQDQFAKFRDVYNSLRKQLETI